MGLCSLSLSFSDVDNYIIGTPIRFWSIDVHFDMNVPSVLCLALSPHSDAHKSEIHEKHQRITLQLGLAEHNTNEHHPRPATRTVP